MRLRNNHPELFKETTISDTTTKVTTRNTKERVENDTTIKTRFVNVFKEIEKDCPILTPAKVKLLYDSLFGNTFMIDKQIKKGKYTLTPRKEIDKTDSTKTKIVLDIASTDTISNTTVVNKTTKYECPPCSLVWPWQLATFLLILLVLFLLYRIFKQPT